MHITPALEKAIKQSITPADIVIIAPLNWGLGHASRCLVLIEYLKKYAKKVILCSDGLSGQLLQREYPSLTYYDIKSPEIMYDSTSMILNGIKQSSALIRHIRIDKQMAKFVVDAERATVIISDNRFGFRDQRCTNIYMTHQLSIMAGMLSSISTRWHRHIISTFNICWVPDYKDIDRSLAGLLSRSDNLKNITYIEPITRIRRLDLDKTTDILILLSGPEPQRSILEDQLIQELGKSNNTIRIIRGTTIQPKTPIPARWEIIDIATSETVEFSLNSARQIICRSGYSTLMDLTSINADVRLIPTPGQGEQEYLAKYHGKPHNL
jgi:hypothetical protein